MKRLLPCKILGVIIVILLTLKQRFTYAHFLIPWLIQGLADTCSSIQTCKPNKPFERFQILRLVPRGGTFRAFLAPPSQLHNSTWALTGWTRVWYTARDHHDTCRIHWALFNLKGKSHAGPRDWLVMGVKCIA